MKNKLDSYINDITKDNLINWETGENYFSWYLHGDGEGDFEEMSRDATQEVIIDYISYCKSQIQLAKELLKEKYGKEL